MSFCMGDENNAKCTAILKNVNKKYVYYHYPLTVYKFWLLTA